ncbi:hypothetical protein GYMLUDRAFT_32596 [Collybiopsis luxurians FD-317 M1]|nr:hypothetical protein GYMLUDRAFT_32596 [Collybiopsis luxurians FD-317 M1]
MFFASALVSFLFLPIWLFVLVGLMLVLTVLLSIPNMWSVNASLMIYCCVTKLFKL